MSAGFPPVGAHAAMSGRRGTRWARIDFLAAAAVVLWVCVGCSERPDDSALDISGAPESLAGVTTEGVDPIVQGQALFEEHCMECHGEGALGDGPLASTLPVQPANIVEHLGHHTRAQLVQLVTGGIPPAMPAAPITPEQVELIVDYVWTLVPEDEVDALRAMQQHMEMMGDSATTGMPGMDHGEGAMPHMH